MFDKFFFQRSAIGFGVGGGTLKSYLCNATYCFHVIILVGLIAESRPAYSNNLTVAAIVTIAHWRLHNRQAKVAVVLCVVKYCLDKTLHFTG